MSKDLSHLHESGVMVKPLFAVPPLTRECNALIARGHQPQTVVDLARKLQFAPLLAVAFPSMPQHMRDNLFVGACVLVYDSYGDWEVLERMPNAPITVG